MRLALLAFPTVFCLGMGLLGLVRPAAISALFTQTPADHGARNEVRAVYGGFGLGCAALLGWGMLRTDATTNGALTAVAVGFGAMAVGRLLSFALEPSRRFWPLWAFVLLEVALCATILGAARG